MSNSGLKRSWTHIASPRDASSAQADGRDAAEHRASLHVAVAENRGWPFGHGVTGAYDRIMCGRFLLLAAGRDLADAFDVPDTPLFERYNIAPGQTAPVILALRPPPHGWRQLFEIKS